MTFYARVVRRSNDRWRYCGLFKISIPSPFRNSKPMITITTWAIE